MQNFVRAAFNKLEVDRDENFKLLKPVIQLGGGNHSNLEDLIISRMIRVDE